MFGQAAAPAKPLSPLEQTLMDAENSFVAAAKKGDVAFFKRTLTDDFSFVQFDGQLYDRQDMLDQFGDGGMDLLPYDMKVVTAGEGVAIVTYDVVLRVPPTEDQGPPPRYQHFKHREYLGEAGRRMEDADFLADDGVSTGEIGRK